MQREPSARGTLALEFRRYVPRAVDMSSEILRGIIVRSMKSNIDSKWGSLHGRIPILSTSDDLAGFYNYLEPKLKFSLLWTLIMEQIKAPTFIYVRLCFTLRTIFMLQIFHCYQIKDLPWFNIYLINGFFDNA